MVVRSQSSCEVAEWLAFLRASWFWIRFWFCSHAWYHKTAASNLFPFAFSPSSNLPQHHITMPEICYWGVALEHSAIASHTHTHAHTRTRTHTHTLHVCVSHPRLQLIVLITESGQSCNSSLLQTETGGREALSQAGGQPSTGGTTALAVIHAVRRYERSRQNQALFSQTTLSYVKLFIIFITHKMHSVYFICINRLEISLPEIHT